MLTLAAFLALSTAAAFQDEAAYPTFRGAGRDGHSKDKGLLRQWPSSGPKLAWKTSGLGAGYSGIAAYGGRLYTLADLGSDCALVCLDAADGKTVWTNKFGRTYVFEGKPTWGNNRATPTTDGRIVIGLNAHGELLCADAATGKDVWKKDLKKDFGGRVGKWDYSESPTIDGDLVVCVAGGSKGTVLALKKSDGSQAWRSTEFTDSAEYASLVPVELGGVRQYLVFTMNTLAGIAAKDGKLLWKAAREGKTAVIPTPVVKGDLVFTCSGYGVGETAFRVTASGGTFKAEEVYTGRRMQNHHGGVILVGDHLYGISDPGMLRCIEIKSGNVAWEEKVPKGSLAFADGLLIARAENAREPQVILVEASPSGYKELGRFTQPEPSTFPKWAHPTVYGGRLFLRDWDKLFAYEVK
jgi:outer membrane protein assembly factor BamB